MRGNQYKYPDTRSNLLSHRSKQEERSDVILKKIIRIKGSHLGFSSRSSKKKVCTILIATVVIFLMQSLPPLHVLPSSLFVVISFSQQQPAWLSRQ